MKRSDSPIINPQTTHVEAMNHHFLPRFILPFAVGLLIALFFMVDFGWASTLLMSTRYVAPGGNCGSATPCYSTIQAAVDAAVSGDEIRIAAGTYTGVQTKLSATTSYTYTQIAFVDGKGLTIAGGYTTSDWNSYDPVANPTILDATSYGRGITVVGDGSQNVMIKGLQIVNGDYTNLGNAPTVANAACPATGSDCAGGLFAQAVEINLQDLSIRNNKASRLNIYSQGGGVLLWETNGDTLVENTQIYSNTTTINGYGGGMVVLYTSGGITIRNSQFDNNHSTFDGGGIIFQSVGGNILVEDSRFVGNSASGSSAKGGAIQALMLNNMTLNRVEFRNNIAAEDGAAVIVQKVGGGSSTLSTVNVLAAGNILQGAATYGSAISIRGGTYGEFGVNMAHTTIANNQTPAGIRIDQLNSTGAIPFTTAMTNTLFANATYGVVGAHYTQTLTIDQTNSLFYNVTNQTAVEVGTPTFNTTGTVVGNPNFDGNYRLQAGSAAIDAGINSNINLDLDKGGRPAGAGYDIGADEYSAGAPGTFRFAQATYGVAEGSNVTLTVERINGSSGTATVQYASSNGTATAGSDYTATSGTLTFANGETSKTFILATIQDGTDEPDETVSLTLSNATGGATIGSPSLATVVIQDDDVSNAGDIKFAQATFNGTEDGGTATITVSRTGGSSGAVSVDYVTSDGSATAGSDYNSASGTLNFADGETSKTFAITMLNDTEQEGDETVNLVLSNVTGGATLGNPNQATLIIQDDDVVNAGNFKFSTANYSVVENAGNTTITVIRTSGSDGTVAIDYATSNGTATAGSDYTATAGTLTFADGETSKTFTIPILSDSNDSEGDETVNLTLTNATNGGVIGTPNPATLTITDGGYALFLPTILK